MRIFVNQEEPDRRSGGGGHLNINCICHATHIFILYIFKYYRRIKSITCTYYLILFRCGLIIITGHGKKKKLSNWIFFSSLY